MTSTELKALFTSSLEAKSVEAWSATKLDISYDHKGFIMEFERET